MSEREHTLVPELIAATAAANPDAIAVAAGSRQLTYRDLNVRANQLARFLHADGIGPDALVGLSLRSSPEMVVGMLGILKAGGAYVPLDPSYPTERLSFMMQDSRIKILLTTSADLAKTGSVTDVKVVRLDADWSYIGKEDRTNFDSAIRPQNLAYVIYTSGSTGKPKGVMVTHSGLANYLLWAAKEYGPEARHSALVHSSISFDLTITGLFTPLLLGGRVELLAEDAGIDGLLAALRGGESYGLVKITPAHLELLRYQNNPHQMAGKVGIFVIGGENLTAESLRFWREISPGTRLINEYGPTETVVGSSIYEVGADDPHVGSVPIGKPIDNTQLYVLDGEQRTLPAGIAGELYIGGAGVARGYLNLPELTEQRFLIDPFSEQPDARMYRTGDLVRRRESGIFEYLGRLDDQVKLRGYRIELGEVEAAIAEHPAIRQSAALVQTESSGHRRLVGYAVRRANHVVSRAQLREFLAQKLPDYMVPAAIVFLEALPLTSNGKINRGALPAPEKEISEGYQSITRPKDEIESKLATIFQKVLNVSTISTSTSFFDLEGDSLRMVQLLAEIEIAFGKYISMAALFDAPSVSALAQVLRNGTSEPPEVIPLQPAGFLSPFFCFGAGRRLQALASHLGTEHPFLSLLPNTQSAEFMQMRPPHRIEDIAAYSARIIREYQREGPYYIGGWSALGVVAYEIAQQLMASGHEVGLLALFDVKNPAASPRLFKANWFEARRQKVTFFAKELKELRLRDVRRYVDEKATSLKLKMRPMRMRKNGEVVANLEDLVSAAVGSYRPRPYAGRVMFFRAASRPGGHVWDFSTGWRSLVKGEFEVQEISGDHRSIFSEPHVIDIAKSMTKYLSILQCAMAISQENILSVF